MGHSLKPCVVVGGQGVTPAVVAEVVQALNHHELVKVQLPGASSALEKTTLLEALAAALGLQTHVVQRIGRMVLLYQAKAEATAKIPLSSLGRKDKGSPKPKVAPE